MTDLHALRERIAGLTGPDRGVDIEIARAFFRVINDSIQGGEDWRIYDDDDTKLAPGRWHRKMPAFTASIDAAVALIERCLPGCVGDVDFGNLASSDPIAARLFVPGGIGNHVGYAPTPALALLLALIDAKIAEKEAG